MNKINNKIIKDYLAGKANDKEMEQLAKWLELSEENSKRVFGEELIYHIGKPNPLATQEKISKAEEKLFNKIAKEETKEHHLNLRNIIKYAAIFLIVLMVGGGMFTYLHRSKEYITVAAQDNIQHITLPDNSVVWLNKGASISYNKDFDGDERRVNIKGEALFKVTKNPEKPFIVSSNGATARVLGTTFNFNEHGKNGNEEISLIEGRLEVTGLNHEGKVILHPNQKATINKESKSIQTKKEYTPVEAAWRDNMVPFENLNIIQIAQIIEQLYDVNVTVDSSLNNQKTYSEVIKKSSDIRTVLNGLAFTISFKYTIEGKKIILSAP